jgi:phage terminase large subunit GpA-like protein
VPGGGVVAAMTAGVDTQDHGFWYEIRAWGYGGPELSKESWDVRSGYVTTWGELEKILWEQAYQDVAGNQYVVNLVIQDALGHRTAEVYNFAAKNRGRILCSFGKDKMAQPYTYSNIEYYPGTKKPIPGGIQAVNVNTKYYKDELSHLLEINPADPGAWHFNSEMPEAWAAHYTAEYFDEKKGVWACPSHKDNHLWDCSVLNLVAHDILGVKFWPKPEGNETSNTEQQIVAKSKFVTGG